MTWPLVNFIVNLFNKIGIEIDTKLLTIILYNGIPGFIFGTLLLCRGLKYNDKIIMLIGLCLLVIDVYHFIHNYDEYRKNK